MPKVAISILLSLFMATSVNAQLGKLDSLTAYDLFDLWFFDDEKGVLAGDSGKIWTTANAGGLWIPATVPSTEAIRDIWFKDNSNGFAVGDQGTFLTTSNGGASWSTGVVPVVSNLTSIFFATAQIGIITGESGVILRTTNGGSSWILLPPASVFYLSRVNFTDSMNGIIVGGSGAMLTSSDQGANWADDSALTNELLIDIEFLDADTGFICGNNGVLYSTVNGGTDWDTLTSNTTEKLLDIECLSTSNCFAVGENGEAVHLQDSIWTPLSTNTAFTIWAVEPLDDIIQYGAGNGGTLLKSCPIAGISTPFTFTQEGKTLQFVNTGKNTSSVKWYFGDGDSSISNNPFHSWDVAGNYWVRQVVHNETDCSASDSILITVASGIDQYIPGLTMTVYPNPAISSTDLALTIEANEQLSIEVVDVLGRVQHREQVRLSAGHHIIPVGLPGKGVFTIVVSTQKGVAAVRISSH